MLEINLSGLIPDDLKQKARDALVDFVSEQARKFLGDDFSGKVKKLRSDAAFRAQFEKSLQAALKRFVDEYEAEDEDLVAAIAQEKGIFTNREIQSALLQIIKKPGTYLSEEQGVVVGSFESVLPGRRNRERVDRAVSFLLKCIAQEVWNLPEFQPIYSLQFQRITAEALRQQGELQKAQLLALTDMNRGIKETLLQLTAAMEQKLLAAPAAVKSLPRPRPYHNIPRPDYNRFVGRESELAWLRERLASADRTWQIAINGIGGVGKSTLALTIAHEYKDKYNHLPPEERFEAIIWVSAKEEVLTVQGREKAALPELVLRTLEDAYTAIAGVLEREDIPSAPPAEQGRIVAKALQERRTLLIMDNLESVKDERIRPFLRNLPHPTKAIITSREWLDVADVLHLRGLSAEEADALILDEGSARHVTLTESQQERIYELTAGIPLPIKLAVARLSGGESFEAVARWLGDASGDLPEYCISGQAEHARRRNPISWKLLLICSLFDRRAGASRDALGTIADISIAERDKALAELQRLFLVSRTSDDRFWVLPIVQRYANLQFLEDGPGKLLTSRWLDWLAGFARSKNEGLEWQAEKIAEFSPEYPNILSAIRWCYEKQDWPRVAALAELTWSYTFITGLFNETREILDVATQAAQACQDERLLGRTLLQRARLDEMQNSLPIPEIIEAIGEGEGYALKYAHAADLRVAWTTRASLYRSLAIELNEQGKTDEAEAAFLAAEGQADAILEEAHKTGDLRLQYLGAIRRSELAADKKDYAAALHWAELAEQAAIQLNASRVLTNVWARKGSILWEQGNLEEAEKYLLKSLEVKTRLGLKRHIAWEKARLARVYLQMGNTQLARQYAQEAIESYKRLGMERSYKGLEKFMEEAQK
jgi:LuxR family glucitol operon transcriptional activator